MIYQMKQEPDDGDQSTILPTEVGPIQKGILFVAFLGYVVTVVISFCSTNESAQMIDLWVWVEASSLIFLVPYYIL